jgi:hypothetical protein
MAPCGSNSHTGTSVIGVSVHSSQKSDDGGYVQEMIMNLCFGDRKHETSVANSIIVIFV